MYLSSSSSISPPISDGSPTIITSPGMLSKLGLTVPDVGWLYTTLAGERFLVGVGIVQLVRLLSLFVGRLTAELLLPGELLVFAAVTADFLFRRGLAGGRVSEQVFDQRWCRIVFKQSRGEKVAVLWCDINSCIGSRISHNLRKFNMTDVNPLRVKFFDRWSR